MKQRIVACPIRNDGHDAEGNPGDCLRAAVAHLFEQEYDEVPHFVLYLDWFGQLRRFGRKLGADFACYWPKDVDLHKLSGMDHFLAAGPSPRGPWWHVVVVDRDLNLVFDPHPSDAGITAVEEIYLFIQPYEPAPQMLMLEAA